MFKSWSIPKTSTGHMTFLRIGHGKAERSGKRAKRSRKYRETYGNTGHMPEIQGNMEKHRVNTYLQTPEVKKVLGVSFILVQIQTFVYFAWFWSE